MIEDSAVNNTPTLPPPANTGGESKGWFRDILETVLPALIIVLVVNVFLAQATRVEGQSMEPNLYNDQRLIIEKISYRLHPPQRGDIIVLKLPNRPGPPLIKRIVGLPGEVVEIRQGHVYINGAPLNEPYLNQLTFSSHPVETMPDDSVFVLGDNRGYSADSRSFGVVRLEYILGHAWFRYWPLEVIGLVE
jgi:signal peptidase I